MNKRNDAHELLRAIDEATAAVTGTKFFEILVRSVARALDARCSFVGELDAGYSRVRTLAFCLDGKLLDNFEYELEGTPCECVLDGEIVAFGADVGGLFPRHRSELEQIGAESYLAIPMTEPTGRVVGHFAVIDATRRSWAEADYGILKIFATRAAAEIGRRRSEALLVEARRSAESANRAKSEFLANMSHELRTPLNGILGYAQLLALEPGLAPLQRENLGAIERCGEHLLELITDMLDLARIEAGRFELSNEAVDLRDLLTEIAALARLRAGQSGLQFVVETVGEPLASVRLDARRLRQVLLNLLCNAIKFTPTGRVRLSVDAMTTDDQCRLRFDIDDTGPGIAQNDLAHIFEPFYRAADTDPAREGTGLGLTITSRLVREMGGTIAVDSTPGHGSRFRVELQVPVTEAVAPLPVPAARRITGYRGPRRRLLVVDDNADNRNLLRQLLEPLGFVVEQAQNGRDALAAARMTPPDLVFLDLSMPILDGRETLAALRVDAGLAATVVVAMSASAFELTRRSSLAAGFDDFLAKPFKVDTILTMLEKRLALTWNVAGQAEVASRATGPGGSGAVVPPAPVLARLVDLARRGDVQGIAGCLDELDGTSPHYGAFTSRLREQVRGFDLRGMREFLAGHEAG